MFSDAIAVVDRWGVRDDVFRGSPSGGGGGGVRRVKLDARRIARLVEIEKVFSHQDVRGRLDLGHGMWLPSLFGKSVADQLVEAGNRARPCATW